MVPSSPARCVVILVILSFAAYLPALQLPFIADDYQQIQLARDFAKAGWEPLWHNPDLRTRTTYMFLSAALDRISGFEPSIFYLVSLLLHSLCTVMLYSLGLWLPIGGRTAFLAACFFAVFEGHQEAVMWLAASHDLLVFLFGITALVYWIRYLATDSSFHYIISLVALLLAAASNETFCVFVALMAAVTFYERRGSERLRRAVIALAPFIVLSIVYVAFMWATRVAGSAKVDDRFTISGAMFATVAANSLWHLLLPQGLIAIGILAWTRRRADWFRIAFASFWIVAGILPHSFLTYMTRIASRHTYLASAGLALLVGAALVRLSKRIPSLAMAAVCVAALAANVEILWVKKMAQFRERGEPTELLKIAALNAAGAITVDCTPVPDLVVSSALASVNAKAVFRTPENHQEHCFTIEYTNPAGAVVRINRRIGRTHGVFY